MRRQSVLLLTIGVVALMIALVIGCVPAAPAPAGPPGPPGPAGPPGLAGAPGVPGKPAAVPPGPGLKLEISKVEIGSDNKPVVTFKMTDAQGNTVRPADVDSGSLRFTIARLIADKETNLTHYDNYIVGDVKGAEYTLNGDKKQPALATAKQVLSAMDAGGKLSETENGYTYIFTNTLPANFDKSATTVVGGQVTRNSRQYAANSVYAFVPAGGTPITREVVKTENCNRCHDPLEGHGGQRIDTRLCVLCHTPQTTDPESGNTVDFKVLVHKLHSGEDLPSVKAKQPYYIVGFNQSVADFSTVAWPQDTRNCLTCHAGAKDGDNWKNAPSAAACTSCHDDVNLKTGENHPGGPQANDAGCKTCHPADSGKEFDASIVGAHTIPNASKQLRGVKFSIVGVADTKPGQNPTVTFNIKDKDGKTIDPKDLNSLSLVLAGPTTDYSKYWSESLVISPTVSTKAKDAGSGNYTYTFSNTIPADAKGTYAVSMQGYINAQIKRADGSPVLGADGKTPLVVRDVGYNPVTYVAVTDATPVPRRKVVLRENCNQCHQDLGNPAGLSIHGGSRQNTEFCVFCHNPNNTDEAQRPADKGTPVPIQFKYLIHRIHTGEEQSTPYIVYGFGGSAVDFSEVRYPGDRSDCVKCHDKNTYLLPLPQGVAPMTVTQKGKVISTTQPVTATCTSCHDASAVKGHATLMTTEDQVETCTVCHGEGKEFAVSKVHGH